VEDALDLPDFEVVSLVVCGSDCADKTDNDRLRGSKNDLLVCIMM
jgi:hypothetical protein